MKTAYVLFALLFSSCTFLVPTASVHIAGVRSDYALDATDTTAVILVINTNMHVDFTMNGSNTVRVNPGEEYFAAQGIRSGWYYLDFVGATTWVRNVPVYLRGGSRIPFEVGANYLDIDGRTFFNSYQEKSTLYPFYPALSLNCYGCDFRPLIRFDGAEMVITQPWMTVTPGWHTIEIYSPLDHVQLYYRTLFDNYTITQFDLYPVSMF